MYILAQATSFEQLLTAVVLFVTVSGKYADEAAEL